MSQVDVKQTRVENLKRVQAARKQNASERVHQVIERLGRTEGKINFQIIAKAANVSVSYLYKYPELKQCIAELRNKQSSITRTLAAKPVSSNSFAKVVSRFKERIHQLEEQNRELRRKNEALAGQVYRVHYLQEQVERQQQTIVDLTTRLKEAHAQVSAVKVTSITQAKSLHVNDLIQEYPKILGKNDNIQSQLDNLGINVNSTLAKLIKVAPEEIVLKAIDALKEALAATKVRNASGFLVEAIRNTWIPNEGYEQKVELNAFKEWYPLAQSLGLVIAATQFDGVQHVLMIDNQWVPFEQMVSEYPLKKLREMA